MSPAELEREAVTRRERYDRIQALFLAVKRECYDPTNPDDAVQAELRATLKGLRTTATMALWDQENAFAKVRDRRREEREVAV